MLLVLGAEQGAGGPLAAIRLPLNCLLTRRRREVAGEELDSPEDPLLSSPPPSIHPPLDQVQTRYAAISDVAMAPRGGRLPKGYALRGDES